MVLRIFVADRLLASYPCSSTLKASSITLQGQVLKRRKPILQHSTGFVIIHNACHSHNNSLRHRQAKPQTSAGDFLSAMPSVIRHMTCESLNIRKL